MPNQDLIAEMRNMEPSSVLLFYVLDASPIGGETLYFYPGTDPEGNSIIWQGNTYTQWPIDATGWEFKTQGTFPSPSITFSNIFGTFSALCQQYDDLIGARVIRKRTFFKFLDGQPRADPTAGFQDDIYYVERKVTETKASVQFELASSMDVDDLQIPRRLILANLCQWLYRSAECSFAQDGVFFTEDGVPINYVERGAYDSSINYQIGDMVAYVPPGGFDTNYVCISPTGSGIPPTDTNYWSTSIPSTLPLHNKGLLSPADTYHVGDFGYTTYQALGQTIRQYFMCIADNSGAGITGETTMPPNANFWLADQCSKRISDGCAPRFPDTLVLPFGGFPGVSDLPS